MPVSFGFHDVVHKAQLALRESGHRTVYTLPREVFREHLAAIRSRAAAHAVGRVDQVGQNEQRAVFLTFDDGRVSAFSCVAPELERLGWRGHFFVITSLIGRPGYLEHGHIRELHRRGHLIGSHSCSHPEQMSSLSWAKLLWEWRESCYLLSEIVGAPITVASVAGGYYSHKVGQSAAASGIKVLFTSEPTVSEKVVDGCRVLGRYWVRRSTPPAIVGAIAGGNKWPRWQHAAWWLVNKAAKRLTGQWYIPLRRVLLDNISRR